MARAAKEIKRKVSSGYEFTLSTLCLKNNWSDVKMLEKRLIEKPNQERLNLLKQCEKCPFFNGCFYFPSSEVCKKLRGE